jgi:hypothetical protein
LPQPADDARVRGSLRGFGRIALWRILFKKASFLRGQSGVPLDRPAHGFVILPLRLQPIYQSIKRRDLPEKGAKSRDIVGGKAWCRLPGISNGGLSENARDNQERDSQMSHAPHAGRSE